MTFDIKSVAYNKATDSYVRKDALLNLIPDTEVKLRKTVLGLLDKPRYNTKIILTVIYEGYPDCPCCGKPIKIAGSGSMGGKFINYCGDKACRSKFMSSHTEYAKENHKKNANKVRKGLEALGYTVVKEHPTKTLFKVKCSHCGVTKVKGTVSGCLCQRDFSGIPRVAKAIKPLTKKEWTAVKALAAAADRKVSVVSETHMTLTCLHCDSETKVIRARSYEGKGCRCQNKVAFKPEYAKSHRALAKSKNIKVVGDYVDSETKVVHKCLTCDNVWETSPDRLHKHGCPSCSAKEAAPRAAATRKKNCLENYGVEYASQRPEVFAKIMKSRYKFKAVRRQGKTFQVQGYEGDALDILLSEGHKAKDIMGHKGMEAIPYKLDGVNRMYFPDFKIGNTIIEVKSTYTYLYDLPKNKAKERSCKRLGYDFRFMVIDKGVLLTDRQRRALEKTHG